MTGAFVRWWIDDRIQTREWLFCKEARRLEMKHVNLEKVLAWDIHLSKMVWFQPSPQQYLPCFRDCELKFSIWLVSVHTWVVTELRCLVWTSEDQKVCKVMPCTLGQSIWLDFNLRHAISVHCWDCVNLWKFNN